MSLSFLIHWQFCNQILIDIAKTAQLFNLIVHRDNAGPCKESRDLKKIHIDGEKGTLISALANYDFETYQK